MKGKAIAELRPVQNGLDCGYVETFHFLQDWYTCPRTFLRYVLPTFTSGWLKRNIWQYNAKAYSALRAGILAAYEKLGIDASEVKFSTHIATVVATPKSCAAFFNCLKENGYAMDTAGISYYPSAPSLSANLSAMRTPLLR